MLLSQRIAKDPNWLRLASNSKSCRQMAIDLRMKVIRAVKMIVPRELLDTDRDMAGLDRQIFGHSPNQEESQRRLNLYSKFSRLPYPLLFVENHTGANLLELLPDGSFNCYTIMDTGLTLYFCTNVSLVEDGVNANTRWLIPKEEVEKAIGPERFSLYLELLETTSVASVIQLAEMLLYVNTKNVVQHHVTPSKRENQMVPKPLLPYHSYYVLDVFRDRKEYVRLEDVIADLCDPNKPVQARRAGLVMGHFKKRATGLFWWNNYIRNARNAETHGVIDKDYEVH